VQIARGILLTNGGRGAERDRDDSANLFVDIHFSNGHVRPPLVMPRGSIWSPRKCTKLIAFKIDEDAQ
jgi:hypothetical protein